MYIRYPDKIFSLCASKGVVGIYMLEDINWKLKIKSLFTEMLVHVMTPFFIILSLISRVCKDRANKGSTVEPPNKGHFGDNINLAVLSL